ncbi:hypothetical protein LCGC14_1673140 [marine sediment metagenome]|uniref:DUF6874 domain-containing protein n=1 Tax=marine sediment metagenome TaxID=412755 RepID=A0A0F9HQQ2_9ZZZZ
MTKQRRRKLIHAIAKRASSEIFEGARDLISIDMDIDYASRHIGINLVRLRDFDAFNFAHDICGIYRHLNRTTLRLEDCFIPRSAAIYTRKPQPA